MTRARAAWLATAALALLYAASANLALGARPCHQLMRDPRDPNDPNVHEESNP